jgi:gamma-glutamyltranspeptidase/glutathione hydrolase
MVLLASLAFHDGASAAQMVALPRYHHQFLPDRIEYEQGAFDVDTLLGLQWMGHEVELREHSYGNMQVVLWDRASGEVQAASDPRGGGAGLVLPAK